MGYHIDGPHTAGSTRRGALGIGVFLLASGVLGTRASALDGPPDTDHRLNGVYELGDQGDRSDHSDDAVFDRHGGPEGCHADYDAEFEALLEAAAEQLGDSSPRNLGPPGKLTRPLRRRFRVTARYGVPGAWLAGHHTGIDLAVPRGTPVYAVGAGVVVLARWSGPYGKAVTVRMPDGYYAVYAHLSRISVSQGTRVRAGTRLGSSGSTGRATGPHLHLEIRRRRRYGSDVNPVRYLARRGVRLV
ncbi:M23 family metallopeptidase [Streptomyces sp. CC224B]|uniref:M23 family metallopeptidase n=1 Tax=Streptomyces sp. CC224B TaxID=3044571 RepID=UPI0024A86B4C|nr:M23 family metallopeptidase [Streptomyces sp. CC224B]